MPEGSIKFSVMPAGKKNEKKCFFSLNLTDFNKLFLKIDQKIESESILRIDNSRQGRFCSGLAYH